MSAHIKVYDDNDGFVLMPIAKLAEQLLSRMQVSVGAMGLQVSSLLEEPLPDVVIDVDGLELTTNYSVSVAGSWNPLLFLNTIIAGQEAKNKPAPTPTRTEHNAQDCGAKWVYGNLMFETTLDITLTELQLLVIKNGVQYGIPLGISRPPAGVDIIELQGGRFVPMQPGDTVYLALRCIGAPLQNFVRAEGYINIGRAGIRQKVEIIPPSITW